MSVNVLLGLGSNSCFSGLEPFELLSKACVSLSFLLENMKISSLYESRAMYYENQTDFFNMAVYGEADDSLSPFELLEEIHKIEAEYGRDRSREIRFGPRSLDIDIEEFGNLVLETEKLVLPHPRMKERAFVLIPALEIFQESADEERKEKFLPLLESVSSQEIFRCPEEVQEKFRNCLEKSFSFVNSNRKFH